MVNGINFKIVFEGTVHEFEPLMVVEGLLGKPLTGFTLYSKSEFLKLLYLQYSKEFYECVATRLFPSIGGTVHQHQSKQNMKDLASRKLLYYFLKYKAKKT